MKIYTLTSIGSRIARSVTNPDTPVYRVIHYLDQHGAATTDQIATYSGLSTGQASGILGRLRRYRPPIVTENSEVRSELV